jgi:hypothetical protein
MEAAVGPVLKSGIYELFCAAEELGTAGDPCCGSRCFVTNWDSLYKGL